MSKPRISIVIPYLQEFPQILFTIRAIHEELIDIDHEIIAIDNLNIDAKKQLDSKKIKIDKGHEHLNKQGEITKSHIKSMAESNNLSWLKYMHFEDHFSLWQARNYGIKHSKADIIMFVDAHCLPSKNSIKNMLIYYEQNWEELNGSIHLPLTYHILEKRKLIYKFKFDEPEGVCDYSFTGAPNTNDIFEVPCMSACGLMCHRSFFDMMGQFPQKGIYSGGEHFFNFVMAILGKKKWIYSLDGATLFHHGNERDYNYTWGCYQDNRAVSNYMFGGEKWLDLFIKNMKADEKFKKEFKTKILSDENINQRNKIVHQQQLSIEDWATKYIH